MNCGMKRYRGGNVGRIALRLAAVLLTVGSTAGCDLNEILAVELPGRVAASDLDDPELAQVLVNSVITDLECAWAQYSAASAVHSDQYIQSSGNLWHRNWGQRRTLADDSRYGTEECGSSYSFYTPFHTARFQAMDIYSRLTSETFVGVTDLDVKLATVRAYGAFALVGLGEGFCEMTVPTEPGVPGPLMTPDQVLELAETRFTEALAHAEAAGNDSLINFALIGRARVRLDLGKYQGVIDDVTSITDPGYLLVATRDSRSGSRENPHYDVVNEHDDTPHASVAPNFRDLTIRADGWPTESDGVADPRVNVVTEGDLGHNNVTIIWFHDKANSLGDDMPIASYKAARLFLAEAYVQTGQLEAARDLINERRTELGLPTFDEPTDQQEMMQLVLEERRRELFIEGGHRLNDMLRFRGTALEIPFLGEPGSIHPDGRDNINAQYGDMTCYPLPTVERIGNPNIAT